MTHLSKEEQVEKLKLIFGEFLKQQGALEAFKKHTTKFHDHITIQSYLSWKLIDDPKNVISGAFPWDETEEGHEYWYNLSTLWIRRNS